MQQFHSMQAFVDYRDNGHVEFTSYDSLVVRLNHWGPKGYTATLFPRWQYSPTTIKQVKRFLKEEIGFDLAVSDLRRMKKEGGAKLGAWNLEFSNEYPHG